MALTPKKSAFIAGLREGASKKDAAIAAGCPEKTASAAGTRLAKDPDVSAEMHRLEALQDVKAAVKTVKGPEAAVAPDQAPEEEGPAGFDLQGALLHRDPKDFLLAVMNDFDSDAKLRVDAAKALMPFVHSRKRESGKKEVAKDKAAGAAQGKFGVSTGTGDLVIEGITYLGVGHFGEVGQAQETDNSTSPMTLDLKLTGLDAYIIQETSIRGCRGRFAKVMLVVCDSAGGYAADILFSGRMDAAQFSYAGNGEEGNSITVPVVDRMAEWSRTGTERFTDENHRARHQGDRFFYAIAQM